MNWPANAVTPINSALTPLALLPEIKPRIAAIGDATITPSKKVPTVIGNTKPRRIMTIAAPIVHACN
jgi:hypothetical protein